MGVGETILQWLGSLPRAGPLVLGFGALDHCTMEAGAAKRLDLRYSVSQTLHPRWPQGHVNLPFSHSPALPSPTVVSEASISLCFLCAS